MSKRYDVVYPQEYTYNGEEKTRWINCGSVFERDGKFSLKLDVVPLDFDGWFKLFTPKPRDNQQASPPAAAQAAPEQQDFTDDDIPF